MSLPSELDVSTLQARLAEFETTIAVLEGERVAWRAQADTLQHERAALQAEVKLLRVERDLYKERAEAIARRLFAAKSEQRGLHQRGSLLQRSRGARADDHKCRQGARAGARARQAGAQTA